MVKSKILIFDVRHRGINSMEENEKFMRSGFEYNYQTYEFHFEQSEEFRKKPRNETSIRRLINEHIGH